MRVIPVIDLKDGHVVRGVGGERDAYRPVQSQLVATAEPGAVAAALVDLTSHAQLYVADLDAIAGAPPNWPAYGRIQAAGATLILDAGIRSQDEAASLIDSAEQHAHDASIVVAFESSASPRDLEAVLTCVGVGRTVFSLDLKHGKPLNRAAAWAGRRALDLAAEAVEIGFQRMIVLDLAAVGVAGGPNVLGLCRAIRGSHPYIELISGGGVRSPDDLRSFAQAGCDGVLVASALHDGRLTPAAVQNADFSGE